MANVIRKITLTESLGGSGPNYKVEWSVDGINYSESIDCGNISLPSVGSFVTCSIDDAANYLRLTSLNVFCTNSVSDTTIPPVGPCNEAVYTIIESGQVEDPKPANTYQYTDGYGVVRSGSLGQYESIMVGARPGTVSVSGEYSTIITSSIDYCNQTFTCVDCNTLDITNTSDNTGSLRNKDIALFYVPCGSSSLDYVLFKSPFDNDSTLPVSGSVCACNSVLEFITGIGFGVSGSSGTLVVGGECSAPPSGIKTIIIESNNNTSWYAGTASQDDLWVNRFQTYNFKQDTYPSGFTSSSDTRIITGSANVQSAITWPIGYGRLSVTQSILLDDVVYTATSGVFDTALTTGNSLTPGAINYDLYDTIKCITTINDAPITGSKTLILNIQNNTSESISWANLNFNFQDTPNFRPLNTTSGITPPVYYYISGSEIPVGSSTFTTNANITASFTSSNLIFDIEPDRNNTIQRYSITSSFFTDGTPRTGGGVSSPTSRVNSSVSADINFNPTTWATLSLDITCSYTASAPPPTSSYCYTLETVQSSQGECFDCPGFFASTTDTVMKIFTECSGSEIFPPFDINVESRYSDNSTSSLFIPTGYTESIIIATSDVQCIPAPECGEDASPTFVSASIVPVSGSIVECCV